jgi:hypothetical protein
VDFASAYSAYLAAADVLDAAAADVDRRGVGAGTANALRGEAAQMRDDLNGAPEGAMDENDREYLFGVLEAARVAAAMAGVLEPPPGRKALTIEQEREIMSALKSAVRRAQTALRRAASR